MKKDIERKQGQTERYDQVGVAMTCRGFAEYELMFGLDEALLGRGPVLDVAAGASSFAAEARSRGIDVVCADPRYALTAGQIAAEGAAEIEASTEKLERLAHRFDWSYYGDIASHKAGRIRSLELFVRDYERHAGRGRYTADMLPRLSFADHSFALVLCSHFLFLYREQFDDAFHRAALAELLRVCRPGGEVRVYPLLSLGWEPYPQFPELIAFVEGLGGACSLEKSGLPFIPGSTDMLRIRKTGDATAE
ncbi:class I SAM-dependent methyltransferase [Paenibacillus sp. GYB003]|uniref:class I SAM-dependent methyltransferase n=1 Tax=Paenibacillus sp. GYB003 TaxID=2994392 RepID=UPI002F9615E0